MPKVAGQFNDSYAPIADGVAGVVKNYALWLQRSCGWKCCVVTPEFPGYSDAEEFDVLRYRSVPLPGRRPYRSGIATFDRGFLRELRRIRFDIIHAHSPFSAGWLGLKIAREQGVPIITTFHSKYLDDIRDIVKSERVAKAVLNALMRFYDRVDEVWTVSRSSADTLREYGYRGRVEVVGNGVDLEGCPEKESDADRYMKLLFVGQHVWHKNLKMLVCALKILKDSGAGFKMKMVGEGNARGALIRLVQRLGMETQFEFTGRISAREKLKSLDAEADLFLMPSVYDTFSLAVREAAAYCCPSVVIKGSAAAENIADGINGFLSENDEQSYARAIMRASSDRARLRAAGAEARRTIFRPWESIMGEVADRYEHVIRRYKE